MKMIKVLAVLGTRPEAIKMCPVIKELEKYNEVQVIVCTTGQHREMLVPILKVFQVTPQYDLNIMKEKQTLFDITGNAVAGMREVLEREKPETVLVHGDTTSAFAAALACFYMKIPVCHVEAGLRTYNHYSPYPEEFNRQAVDSIAEIFFAPTETAKMNLVREGRAESKIFVTGNTVIDALKTTVCTNYSHEILQWAGNDKLILLTAHRRENVGKVMEKMFLAVKEVAAQFEDVKVVYPVHMNPEVQGIAEKVLGDVNRIKLVAPLEVVDFHNIMSRSYFIMTDSGGIQEEAPALGKPVLVMRNTTERPEGVKAGTLKLVGTEQEEIRNAMMNLLTDKEAYRKMATATNPYGDGRAAERIAKIILSEWEMR